MKELLFFSRHEPTDDQLTLALEAGYKLVWKGDLDAFNTSAYDALGGRYHKTAKYVCVVHPMLALEFSSHHKVKVICIFESANRDGAFKAVKLHQWFNPDYITKEGISSKDVPF